MFQVIYQNFVDSGIIKGLNMAEQKPILLKIVSAFEEYKNTNTINPTNFISLKHVQIIINKRLTKNRKCKRLLKQCQEYIQMKTMF